MKDLTSNELHGVQFKTKNDMTVNDMTVYTIRARLDTDQIVDITWGDGGENATNYPVNSVNQILRSGQWIPTTPIAYRVEPETDYSLLLAAI